MTDSDFGYANSLNGICERVTTTLEDDQPGKENNRWSKCYLLAAAADALKMFAHADPTLFAEAIQFPLTLSVKGLNDVPAECEMLVSIDSIIDDIGRPVNVQKADFATLQKASYFAQPQRGRKNGKIRSPVAFSVAINPDNTRQFAMNPKVPAGVELTACATCTNVSRFIDDPDLLIDCAFARFIPALHQWLLYVALMQDSGSEAVAEQHRIAFFDLIPYSLKDMRRAASRLGGG